MRQNLDYRNTTIADANCIQKIKDVSVEVERTLNGEKSRDVHQSNFRGCLFKALCSSKFSNNTKRQMAVAPSFSGSGGG